MDNMDKSTKALKDFDIALSLNQRAINCQLQSAWEVWGETAPGGRLALNINPLNSRGLPSSTRLDAEMEPPKLSFSRTNTAPDEVITSIKLFGGSLKYLSDGDSVEVPMHEYVLSLRSVLKKRTVSWKQLYAYDEECADGVLEHLQAYQLAEGQFSIECLFLTLTNKGTLLLPEVALPTGATLSPEARGKLAECIETWATASGIKGANGLLLSASVVPRHVKRAPSVSMADYAFRLNKNEVPGVDEDRSNTLDYLGVAVGGRELPGAGAELLALCEKQGIWPSYHKADAKGGLFAGVMVLRKDLYIDHLRNGLSAALKREIDRMAAENAANPNGRLAHPELDFLEELRFVRDGDSLFLQGSKTYRWTDNELKLVLDKELRLEIKLVQGKVAAIEGLLYSHLDRDRTTSWDVHSGAKATRKTTIGGTMTLHTDGEAACCSVTPKFQLSFTHLVGSKDDVGDISGFVQFFTRIKNDWDVKIAGDWLGASRDAIIAMLQGVFSKVEVDMNNFAFVLPGEDTFTFRHPELNQFLDLTADVTYREA